MYGDSSRLRTGVRTEIIVNPQEPPSSVDGGSGTGSGSQQPPAFFINGATDALTRLINKNMNKTQINTMLENYRRMIALETNTPYVATVISSVSVGVNMNPQDGKLTITTVSTEGPKGQSEIVIN